MKTNIFVDIYLKQSVESFFELGKLKEKEI